MEAVSTKSEAVTADHGEPGTFLIADISGYTEYLSGADLEDAPTIAHDLLSEVIEAMRPAFAINKIEGDAVFTFDLVGSPNVGSSPTARTHRRNLLSPSQVILP